MDEPVSAMPSEFDRKLAQLHDLPDVVKTKPTIHRVVPMLGVGGVQLYTIQTVRQGDDVIIFLEHVMEGRLPMRIVMPSEVCDIIARQRDSVSTMLRKKIARTNAADRKAHGKKPGFKMTAAERLEAKREREKKGKKT